MAPIYEYVCPEGHYFDRYLPLANYAEPQRCQCGREGRKLFPRVHLIRTKDIHYDSPIDGRPITSEAARREDLARSNCQPYDPEMKTDYNRRSKDSETALEKAFDDTVDREIAAMPARKREKLEAELAGGMDVAPARFTPPAINRDAPELQGVDVLG